MEQTCAQIFLAIDSNENRLVEFREGLRWIFDYADESIVGSTDRQKKRYYKRTARAKAAGEDYDPADWKEPMLWPEFLRACKEV